MEEELTHPPVVGVEAPLTPGPVGYLVHQHAGLVVAIQELREEVSSLLEFKDAVAAALPHIHPPQPPPPPLSSPYIDHSSPPSSSSKAPPPTTTSTGGGTGAVSGGVSDSGFTDKNWCSGSMKTTSSSCTSNEGAGGDEADELLLLLDAIEKKGSKLQRELSAAKSKLYETTSEGGLADSEPSRLHQLSEPMWPLSLPPSSSSPLVTSLICRASTAEKEAAEARERLTDIHACLSIVLTEKRRLERELKYRGGGSEDAGYSYPPMVGQGSPPHLLHSYPNSAPQQHPFLPRVLKVPIKDKEKKNSVKRKISKSMEDKRSAEASSSDKKLQAEASSQHPETASTKAQAFKLPGTDVDLLVPMPRGRSRSMSTVKSSPVKGLKVTPVKVGGVSSLPPGMRVVGGRVSVTPNRTRIASILREKNVLELQRQLLHTVMEAEVLRCQVTVIQEQLKESKLEIPSRPSPSRHVTPKHNKLLEKTKAASPKHSPIENYNPQKATKVLNKETDIKEESGVNSKDLISEKDIPESSVNIVNKSSDKENVDSSAAPARQEPVKVSTPTVDSSPPVKSITHSPILYNKREHTVTLLPNNCPEETEVLSTAKEKLSSEEEPSHRVHKGPNVKYHVMVHKEEEEVGAVMREKLPPPSTLTPPVDSSKVKDRSLTELLSHVKNSSDKTLRSILSEDKSTRYVSSTQTKKDIPAISSSSMVAKIINSKLSGGSIPSVQGGGNTSVTTTNYRRMTAAIEKPPRNRGTSLSSKFHATNRMDDVPPNASPKDAVSPIYRHSKSHPTPNRLSVSPNATPVQSKGSGGKAPSTTVIKSPKQASLSRADRMSNLTKPTVASAARRSSSFKSPKSESHGGGEIKRSHSGKSTSRPSQLSVKMNTGARVCHPRPFQSKVSPQPKAVGEGSGHSKQNTQATKRKLFQSKESKGKGEEIPSFCTLSYAPKEGVTKEEEEEFYDSIGDAPLSRSHLLSSHSSHASSNQSLDAKHLQSTPLPRWAERGQDIPQFTTKVHLNPPSEASQTGNMSHREEYKVSPPSLFAAVRPSLCKGANPLRAVTMNPVLSGGMSPSPPLDSLEQEAERQKKLLETSVDSI